jgi:hypothetical protein
MRNGRHIGRCRANRCCCRACAGRGACLTALARRGLEADAEGRSPIYVARQLGHGADLTLKVYGHVIQELEDAPGQSADDAISAARDASGTRLVPVAV